MKIKTENYEFKLLKAGLWLCDDGKKKRKICDHILPVKFGHVPDGNQWFMDIKFRNRLGASREIWVPMDKIYQRGFLVRELQGRGLKFSPGVSEKAFIEFIHAVEPAETVVLHLSTGWVDDNLFFRGKYIVGNGDRPAILLPSISDDVAHIRAKGSLEKWQKALGHLCLSSRLLIVSVCAAFSAPLCKIADMAGGGIHVYGLHSIGKTTCLNVAASVVGDPTKYVETWFTTKTAIEQTAARYNCLLLCMDELTQASSNKPEAAQMAKELSYLFGNGKPKRRDRGYEAMSGGRQPSFSVSVLSSGEQSLSATAAAAKWSRLGGEEIRIIDLKADQEAGLGVFDKLPKRVKSAALLSDRITLASQNFYGTPFKVFMEQLITTMTPTERRERVKIHINTFLKAAEANERLIFHHRFAKRFAIFYAGGALAVELKVLDWSLEVIFTAVMSMYEAACVDRRSTHEAQVRKVVKLVRRNLRKGVGIVDFSDEGGCETEENAFKDHRGLRLRDAEGKLIAYKIRGELLREWCGPDRMTEAVIDWFDEHQYLEERPKPYQGIQDQTRKIGKTENRWRYFTFQPRVIKHRKLKRVQ